MASAHSDRYLAAVAELAQALDADAVDAIATGLAALRERRGRLFVLGVGGGAGHASHAVNDFRKLCEIESYVPTDDLWRIALEAEGALGLRETIEERCNRLRELLGTRPRRAGEGDADGQDDASKLKAP